MRKLTKPLLLLFFAGLLGASFLLTPCQCRMRIHRGFSVDTIYCTDPICAVGGACGEYTWGGGPPTGVVWSQCRCGGQTGTLDPNCTCHATKATSPDGSWTIQCQKNGCSGTCEDMTGPGGCPGFSDCDVCVCP